MKKLNTKGAVSLLTVVIFATIITVVIAIYARIAINQQGESINYDLSNRAFYAAQGGFEDTVRAIDDGTIKASDYASTDYAKNECALKPDGNSGQISSQSDVGYTCQLIDFTPSEFTITDLEENQSILVPLIPRTPSPGTADYKLVLTWSPSNNARVASGKTLPTRTYWNNLSSGGAPPMLRSMFFWFGSGSLSRGSIKNQSLFLNPYDPASVANADGAVPESPTINLAGNGGAAIIPPNQQGRQDVIENASCVSGAGGNCSITIKIASADLSAQKLFLVIKPIYRSAQNISIVLQNSAGTVLPFGTGQAKIDITGHANNVYRRIVQNYSYGTYKVTKIGFPDYSIVGGNGICKLMTLTASSVNSDPACN